MGYLEQSVADAVAQALVKVSVPALTYHRCSGFCCPPVHSTARLITSLTPVELVRSLNLTQVGTAKPKFPLLDAPRSALLALALELRAANPRTSQRRDGAAMAQQYTDRRERYTEQCKFVEHARAEVVRRFPQPGQLVPFLLTGSKLMALQLFGPVWSRVVPCVQEADTYWKIKVRIAELEKLREG